MQLLLGPACKEGDSSFRCTVPSGYAYMTALPAQASYTNWIWLQTAQCSRSRCSAVVVAAKPTPLAGDTSCLFMPYYSPHMRRTTQEWFTRREVLPLENQSVLYRWPLKDDVLLAMGLPRKALLHLLLGDSSQTAPARTDYDRPIDDERTTVAVCLPNGEGLTLMRC